MKKYVAVLLAFAMAISLSACGSTRDGGQPQTLVYGSGDYTRINPAMDEHGEINLLLFNGLTAHNGKNEVVPGLAERWEFDAGTCTYTFDLARDVFWHDGEKFTADDVKFTIEAIMDPENGSEMRRILKMCRKLPLLTMPRFRFGWRRRMRHFWII